MSRRSMSNPNLADIFKSFNEKDNFGKENEYEVLNIKRKALQDVLETKIKELKSICVQEGVSNSQLKVNMIS